MKTGFRKISFIYLVVSGGLLATACIYELFSHGIYSFSMIFAFTVPLTLGTLLNAILERLRAHPPGCVTSQLWHSGVGTLTLGLFVSGVFQIYGTANSLLNLYYIAGVVLLAVASVLYFTVDKR